MKILHSLKYFLSIFLACASLIILLSGLAFANSEEVVTEPSIVGNEGAVNITQTSAGLLVVLHDLGTAEVVEVFFEWGTSSGEYVHETASEALDGTGLFDSHLEELQPGTTYYFRAVAIGDGVSYSE